MARRRKPSEAEARIDADARAAGQRWAVIVLHGEPRAVEVAGEPGAMFVSAGDPDLLEQLEAAGVFDEGSRPSIAVLAREVATRGVALRQQGELAKACLHQRIAACVAVRLGEPEGIEATTASLWVLREALRDVAERALGPAREPSTDEKRRQAIEAYAGSIQWASRTIATDAARLAPLVRVLLAAAARTVAPSRSTWLSLHRLARMGAAEPLRREAMARLLAAAGGGDGDEALLAALEELAELDGEGLMYELGLVKTDTADVAPGTFATYQRLRGQIAGSRRLAELAPLLRVAFDHLNFQRLSMTAAGGAFGHSLSYAVSSMLQVVGRDFAAMLLRLGHTEAALEVAEALLARSMTDWMGRTHGAWAFPAGCFSAEINPVRGSLNAVEQAGLVDIRQAAAEWGPILYLLELPDCHAAWVVRRDGDVAFARLPLLADALAACSRMFPFLASRQGLRHLGRAHVPSGGKTGRDRVLRRLHDALFVDHLRRALDGEGERMVIVADPSFNSVPFAALRSAAERYLIEDCELELWPSVTSRLVIEAGARSPTWQRAAKQAPMAPLVMGLGEFAPLHVTASRGPVEVPPLPGAIAEAKAIAARLHVRACLNAQATPRRLLEAGQGADIVHLATHGFLDAERPERSLLVLAGGTVSAADLYQLDRGFRVGMVVMSACQTGLGGGHPDSVIGLANAFLIAGAQVVVSTLWKIPDHETGGLMQAFYNALLGGAAVSAALRTAQTGALRDPATSDPFQWAALRVTGRTTPLFETATR